MLDLDDNRLATAKELGATHTINSTNVEDLAQVKSLNHRGVDVAIEALVFHKPLIYVKS